jgi:hypothetical protein
VSRDLPIGWPGEPTDLFLLGFDPLVVCFEAVLGLVLEQDIFMPLGDNLKISIVFELLKIPASE